MVSIQMNQENKKVDMYRSNINTLVFCTHLRNVHVVDSTTKDHSLDLNNSSQNVSNSSSYILNNSSSQNFSGKELANSTSKTGRTTLVAEAKQNIETNINRMIISSITSGKFYSRFIVISSQLIH